MRVVVCIFALCSLTACVSSLPPKLLQPEGPYRPVNQATSPLKQSEVRQAMLDFSFDGDMVDVLPALQRVVPSLNVMPPLGQPLPLRVRVDLHATTLENILRTIGAQGGDWADVVWNEIPSPPWNQVFIQFHGTHQRSVSDAVSRGHDEK